VLAGAGQPDLSQFVDGGGEADVEPFGFSGPALPSTARTHPSAPSARWPLRSPRTPAARELRRGIRQRGMGYVMAVRANHASAGSPGTAGPRSACSPTSTSRSPSPCNASKTPAPTWTPDSSRLPFRSCYGSCATPSSHRPGETGPTGCTGPPGDAATSSSARQAHRRWNAYAETTP
jgi:hypothetical protein